MKTYTQKYNYIDVATVQMYVVSMRRTSVHTAAFVLYPYKHYFTGDSPIVSPPVDNSVVGVSFMEQFERQKIGSTFRVWKYECSAFSQVDMTVLIYRVAHK